MWCYVGKASKIFFVVAVLVVVGLLLGFTFLRPRYHHINAANCQDPAGCRPTLQQPEPVPPTGTTAASSPPLLSPHNPLSFAQGPATS